jgi:hypothetical protein
MGARGTLILALLVVIVGAYLWLEEVPPPEAGRSTGTLLGQPGAGDPNQPVRHILDVRPAEVVAIRLERDGTTRATQRSGNTWSNAANPAAINDFLENMVPLAVLMDIPADAADLRLYGLDPPRSVLQLQVSGRSTPLVLQIGNRNPSVTGVYVRLGEDGPVVLAGALVAWEFDKAFRALGPPEEKQ